MTALNLLEELRQAGVTVALADGRLRLRGPQPPSPELLDRLQQHRREVADLLAEVEQRLPAFQHQASRPGPLPFLALPGVEAGPTAGRRCLSCGEDLDGGTWRCPACTEAVRQVLGATAVSKAGDPR